MLPHWVVVNVEAAIVKDGRYLMVVRSEDESHAPGALSFPGGKVESPGQTDSILEATVHRETREEVGVELHDEMAYVESKSFVADDGEPVVDLVFLCRYKSGVPQRMDPAEVGNVRWMSAEEILRDPKAPSWTRQSIERAERLRLAMQW